MGYEYLISRNLALLDLPAQKLGQVKEHSQIASHPRSYLHKIFRQLLIYDQLPDSNLDSVLQDTKYILETVDPAFEHPLSNRFAEFLGSGRQKYIWGKVKKDYNAYIRAEIKRRNSENPYYNPAPMHADSWDALPDFSRQKRNQPWQFDSLFRDSQILAGQIFELLSRFPAQQDKDLFRAKISSILVPEKVIFALNSSSLNSGFGENEITLANLKLSLDAYQLGSHFLDRVIESLHKIRFGNQNQAKLLDESIAFADRMQEKLKARIVEGERRLMLFIEAIEQENRDEEQG